MQRKRGLYDWHTAPLESNHFAGNAFLMTHLGVISHLNPTVNYGMPVDHCFFVRQHEEKAASPTENNTGNVYGRN